MATTLDLAQLGGDVLPERPEGIGTWPRAVWSFCRRKPLGAIGGFIVIAMLFFAVFVDFSILSLTATNEPLLAPDHYDHQTFGNENSDPSWSHPMGTDRSGRDIFSRLLYGARISAVIGFSCVLIAAFIALFVGTISGFFSGWFDTIVQRIVDIVLAIPAIILLLFALTVFASRAGPYKTMFWIILIVGFLLGVNSIRVVRGATISTAQNQYVDAARTIGASNARIILRHIVPNVIPVVIVLATVQVGSAILIEATISFLGFGIPPPFPSWGVMLSRDASNVFRQYPLQAVWPGAAIALSVYGYNIFGDALRDVLDPRLRGSR
jgi:peptide/nickel transport system permease protein